MAKQVRIRRGTSAEIATRTGAANEIWYDTTTNTLVLMDGSTAGGHRLSAESAALLALLALTPAADRLPYFTSSSAAALATFSAAARTVIDDATVADMVNTLGGATSIGTGGLVRDTAQQGRVQGAWVSKTSGTSFTTGSNTHWLLADGRGGGGAGGGAAQTSNQGAAGSGGGMGGRFVVLVAVTPSTTYNYVIAAGGTVGSAGANDGNTGGDTTLTIGSTTYTAAGGIGGKGMASTATSSTIAGGNGSGQATNGDINEAGEPGHSGFVIVGAGGAGVAIVISGHGARGGIARVTEGNGAAAAAGQWGGGGGGGVCLGTTARTGGAGRQGKLDLLELT